MVDTYTTSAISRNDTHNEYQEIMDLLYKMRKGKKNHALLTEFFLQKFANHPEKLIKLISFVKQDLQDESNPHRDKMARRYLYVFSFLCERFGLYEEKLELDDICFAITEPKEYQTLKKNLEKYQKKSQKIIDEIFIIFRKKLEEYGIHAQIQGRYKNLFSIHKKCKQKKLKHVFSLNDIFAFRIIVDDTPEKCFEILNILHDSFIPIPRRYKDYITIPKINGYQSLHTGLLGVNNDLDLAIEVQVRTKIMDEIAESGIAAHHLYAREKRSKMITEKEQKLIENMEKITDSINVQGYIHCLTPAGDLIRLPHGSRVIDFAEKIHTKLAKKAKSALINKKKADLQHKISSFDSIEIVT